MYRGDVKDARRLYQLVEGDKGASETQIIYAHYEQAEITRLDGALKEACDQWDAIAKAAPRSLYAAKSLADAAQTFAGMGQITNCETRFMRVLSEYADYPERHRVLYNLGFLYFFTKDYRKAEVMFKDLVRQYPTTWEAQRVKRVELPAIAADHNPPPTK